MQQMEVQRIIKIVRRTHKGKTINHFTVREIMFNSRRRACIGTNIPTPRQLINILQSNCDSFEPLGEGLYKVR